MQKEGEHLHHKYGNRVRVRVCGACLSDNLMLMVGMRLPGHNGLFWALPGGGMQFGETARETLRREFFEETGLLVEVGDGFLLNEFIQPPLHAIEIFFRITSFRGDPLIGHDPEFGVENQIIEQVRFMSLEEIQQLPDGSKHGIFVGLQTWQELFSKKSFDI